MGYTLDCCSSSVFTIKGGLSKTMLFMDSAAEDLLELEKRRGRLSAATIQSLESLERELLMEKDDWKKYQKFCDLMEKLDVPFEFRYGGYRTSLQFWYNIADYDTWNREDQVKALLKAYAPFAQKGEYLGFVGEDLDIWSYAFDGEGSFSEREGCIEWTDWEEEPQNDPDVYYEVIVETWGGGEQTWKESRIFRSREKAEEFFKANTGTLTKTGMEARSIQAKRFEDA
jgi:hypothetical protein